MSAAGLAQLRSNGVPRVETGPNLLAGVTDNTIDLGSAAQRYRQVFAANGTINTSDAAEKTVRGPLTAAELRVAKALSGLIRVFQWNDAVAEKGEDARLHLGPTAQAVQAAFEAEGLDGFRYGVLCLDEWDDEYEAVFESVEVPAIVMEADGQDGEHPVETTEIGERPTGETVLVRAAGSRMGLRYDQLAMWMAAAADARLAALEAG